MTTSTSMGGHRGLVWVDLLNSPNVLFVVPLLAELRGRGYGTVVTIRDFAQTQALCELYGIRHLVIGEHGGAGLVGKATNLVRRAGNLVRFARVVHPDYALTHNSYSQLIATKALGIPSVTSMDYEYQPANHLAFRCADWVFVPRAFPDTMLCRFGASTCRVWKFDGLKESISLAGFRPRDDYLTLCGLRADRVTVIVRPPAEFALYHRFTNDLFPHVLNRLAAEPSLQVILLPRTPVQAAAFGRSEYADWVWQGEAFDGRELVAAADAVISAGGSMIREAALLGVPAFSVYAGRLAAVDAGLVHDGRLQLLNSLSDIDALVLQKNSRTRRAAVDDSLVSEFIDRCAAAWATKEIRHSE
jgi:hypothetical protein